LVQPPRAGAYRPAANIRQLAKGIQLGMNLFSLSLALLQRYPYPFYSLARRFRPVVNVSQYKLWLVFGYEDTKRVLTEHATFSSDTAHIEGADAMQDPQMRAALISSDPPVHTKLRGLVTRAFTARAVANLEPRIESLTHGMLDRVIETGHMELIDDLAYPLPVVVISEMLGIPAEDRDQFRQWSDQVVRSANHLFGDHEGMQAGDGGGGGGGGLVTAEMEPYLRDIIEQRRRVPGDDLISGLVAAEIDGERLTESDLMSFCSLLLVAGNVTTTNLIGNTMLTLVQHPRAMARLQNDLSLLPAAIEEVLRYRSPVQFMFRVTTRAVELGPSGQTLQPGQIVLAFIGSANRDEAKFPAAHRFDLDREPNQHIAFGNGIHYCLGAPLARLEGRLALTILLTRLRDIRRANLRPLPPGEALILHGVRHLPLVFNPGPRLGATTPALELAI
jgi:cytochrome P450